MRITVFLGFLALGILISSYKFQAQPLLGLWHGKDKSGNQILIHFKTDNCYSLQVNGVSLTDDIADFGQVKYRVVDANKQMKVELYSSKSKEQLGSLNAKLSEDLKVLYLRPSMEEEGLEPMTLTRVIDGPQSF